MNSSGKPGADRVMQGLSNSEYVIGVGTPLMVSAIGLIERDSVLWRKGLVITASVVANTGATFVLKRMFNRPRPALTYPDIRAYELETKYSFPSGHTSNAFVTATSLSLAFKKWYVVVPAYAWATGVGYSRMHLGMHYPTDVLAGALVGAGSAWVCYQGNKWLQKRQRRKP
ncbi:MAG: phosphatase PAP2 family protein [Chitinophagaceae bacterium]|nr:phosphatase PAP2 family protein [Chitinophagaceae bacterium]